MLSRRQLLGAAVAALLVRATRSAWADEGRNVNAFNARSVESALGALEVGTPAESNLIEIDAPDVAENGANVPVEVTVKVPGVERVLVLGERNVFPLLADLRFGPGVVPWFEVKVKLAETSHVRVLALANGQVYAASRQVRVIVGGCLPG
ncbi:MAG TPA: thiosulfate oxidation carrier protein SoxY [Magnetospirillum sp.]|nr:thiosulfate oxidation carrier protein SoxY [Magnetospirillum sp.]